MDELTINVHQTLDELQFSEIQNLLNACADNDGLNPFSEHAVLHMQYGHETEVKHYMCFQNTHLVAYAHVDLSDLVTGPNIEIAVLPRFRRHGVGGKLIELILSQNSSRPIRLWAHGLSNGAAELAAHFGFKQVRTLWQMRRSLNSPISEPNFPSQLQIRSFDSAIDAESWLECNRLTFAHHPEQGQWSAKNLNQRLKEQWFDPEGLKVAVFENEIVGYCWTKVDEANANAKLGEIYVIGIHPNWQNQGLGKAFTIDGLRYLRSLNLNTALLYVDLENEKAIALYKSLGFSHWDTDTMFQLD